MCAVWGCESQPERDYEDFKARAESLRAPKEEEVSVSRIADLSGMWLLRASLSAGIDLGLRVRLFVIDESGAEVDWPRDESGALTTTDLEAEIWLDRQDPRTEEPIVRVSKAPVDAEGRFTLLADPLSLDPATLNLTTAVESIVYLHSETRSADVFCGNATGSVTVPLVIDLAGSTFFVARDDELTLQLADLPSRCPAEEGAEGGAEAGAVAGAEAGAVAGAVAGAEAGGGAGAEVTPQPPSPDLSAVPSALADLTGHWLVNIKLPVPIPLKLWAALIYTPNPTGGGGSLSGALRRELDPFDAPPLVSFSTPVDAEGRFDVWLPGFVLDGAVRVEADLLISGATLAAAGGGEGPAVAEAWCGGGAGEVQRPAPIQLEGTTLYAHRWVPGTPAPEPLLSACP